MKLNSEYHLLYSLLEFLILTCLLANFRTFRKLFTSYELLIFASLHYRENKNSEIKIAVKPGHEHGSMKSTKLNIHL